MALLKYLMPRVDGTPSAADAAIYHVVDVESTERPANGFSSGDLCFCKDTSKLWKATNSTTWADAGQSGGGSYTHPNHSGDVTSVGDGAQTIAAGVVTDAKVAAANKDGAVGTASLRTLGTGAQQACAGDDARLSNARTPTAHTHPKSEVDDAGTWGIAEIPDLDAAKIATGTMATARLGSGTADATTFLRGDQSWAAPAGGGGGTWTTVKKTANEARTANATLTADGALTIALAAATRYHIRGKVFLTTANATMDYKWDLNYSGTTTVVAVHRRYMAAGAAAGTDNQNCAILAALPGSTAVAATTTGTGWIEFDVMILTNASGTFSFRWAQNTSDAGALTVLAGSYLEHATF